jgi:xanthine/CO dehydrogenase XdhC/CoxF family maturation factor
MRDLIRILDAFDALAADGKPAALATLVAAQGSSFRQSGARMLTTADGQTIGAISGGCLERDVLRRSRAVIDTGRATVCAYETNGDIEADPSGDPGAALGCGGSVEVLIQRITNSDLGPIPALIAAVRQRQTCRLATVFRVGGSVQVPIAAMARLTQNGDFEGGEISNPALLQAIQTDLQSLPAHSCRVHPKRYLLDGGWADVFLEQLPVPQQIVVFGDGDDVLPLVEMANILAWQVTVVGHRAAATLNQRFASAHAVICAQSTEELAQAADLDLHAAAVVMTHNLRRDAAILRHLLKRPPRYVGVLGPRHRTARILAINGWASNAAQQLFAPVGLDLGAEAPEQIALSILAEIQSALSGRAGGPLRERPGSIHSPGDPPPAASPPDISLTLSCQP